MTRFRSIAYIVLVLSLLLSYTPIASSEEVKPVTYRAEFIPFGKGFTWKKLIPADSGPLTLDFEMVLSPGTITAEVSGDIHFYDRTETLRVRGTGGKLSSDGGVVLKGAIVLDFMIPISPLLQELFGVNESIHVDQRLKIPALNVNKGWNESKAFNSFLLNVGEWEKVRMEVGVPKLVTLKLSAVDIVPTVVSAILSGGTLTGAVKTFVNKLSDYMDTGIALNAGITSELVMSGKSVTVNGTAIRHEDQLIAAPGVDRSAETYEIESSYEEEFTYTVDLAASGDFYAEVSIFGDIRIWSYRHELAGTRFPILPAETVDLNFGGATTFGEVSNPKDSERLVTAGVIPDPWLARKVRDALGFRSGDPPVTREDMRRLTELKVSRGYIQSLSGMEHAVNLRILEITENHISDISPVSNLKNLTTLNLWGNDVSEVSLSDLPNLTILNLVNNPLSEVSLSNLTNLTRRTLGLGTNNVISKLSLSGLTKLSHSLSFSHNVISEISLSNLLNVTDLDLRNHGTSEVSLSNLPSLTRLFLGDNPLSKVSLANVPNVVSLRIRNSTLSDISALSELPNLTELELSHNPISDVFPLSGLTNLTTLKLGDNAISDVSPLSGLTNLTTLYLRDNAISDVSPLSSLTNLTTLELGDNAISDVSPLSSLTNLTYLNLWHNAISDVSPLSSLTNLTHLYLDNNTISDVSPLSELSNLIHLALWGNSISEVSLSGLPNLTILYLTDNNNLSKVSVSDMPKLTDLALFRTTISELSLSELTSLEGLDIRYTPLSKVSLSNLSALKELVLSYNSLSEVSLSGLPSLTKLELADNSLSDVSGLSGLTSLRELNLSHNSISDISPLVGLPNLQELVLYNNPLNYASRNTHIFVLMSKGVQLRYDHRESPILERESPILEKISGEGQIGVPGSELPTPFVFQALDAEDKPIAGVSVRFVVYEGGGTLSITTATTDATGKAETFLTLGPDPGETKVGVIAEDLKTSVSFTAIASHDAVVERIAEDVNGDGVVNVQDLVLVSSSLGEAGENAADVNEDGIVNIQDLVKVSAALQ